MNKKYMYTSNIKKEEDCNIQFLEFMDKVEAIVYEVLNAYLLDLPDEDYYEFFEQDCTPEQVADIVVKGNMFF